MHDERCLHLDPKAAEEGAEEGVVEASYGLVGQQGDLDAALSSADTPHCIYIGKGI